MNTLDIKKANTNTTPNLHKEDLDNGVHKHPEPHTPPKPPVHPEEPLYVIVNGVEKSIPKHTHELSYKDIVILAYGKYNESDYTIYTVSYSHGPKENPKGTLVKGENLKIKKGMIFNVSRSDKS